MSTPLLSAKLVELRRQRGISQQELASCLGLTREAYSHYECNTREPNLEIIVKLTRFYQIDVSELINEDTILPIKNTIKKVKAAPMPTNAAPKITDNMKHFLKLFTGKNIGVDLTKVSKEDVMVLDQYKKLDKKSQKEVRQFIRFKHS